MISMTCDSNSKAFDNALLLVSVIAIPLMLITLGVSLASLRVSDLEKSFF